MPKYDITIGGQTFEVESPQELSDQQAYAAAVPEYTRLRSQQMKDEAAGRAAGGQYKIGGPEAFRQAAQQVANETGAGGRFLQGVGETFDRYAYGLKGLFTDLAPEEKQRLAQNKVLADVGGPAATVGQIAGDVAITGPAFG